jgi:hypothetical protein
MGRKDGARGGAMSRKPGKAENETALSTKEKASIIHRTYEER